MTGVGRGRTLRNTKGAGARPAPFESRMAAGYLLPDVQLKIVQVFFRASLHSFEVSAD